MSGKKIEDIRAKYDYQSRACGVFTASTVHTCRPAAIVGCIVLEPTCCFSEWDFPRLLHGGKSLMGWTSWTRPWQSFKQDQLVTAAVWAFQCFIYRWIFIIFCFINKPPWHYIGQDHRVSQLAYMVSIGLMPDSIVSYLMKTFWQYMLQISANKLTAFDSGCDPSADFTIFVAKRYMGLVHAQNPIISDGNTKDIPSKIF